MNDLVYLKNIHRQLEKQIFQNQGKFGFCLAGVSWPGYGIQPNQIMDLTQNIGNHNKYCIFLLDFRFNFTVEIGI